MCYCSNYNILKNNNNNSYNFYISELLYLKLSYHSTIYLVIIYAKFLVEYFYTKSKFVILNIIL